MKVISYWFTHFYIESKHTNSVSSFFLFSVVSVEHFYVTLLLAWVINRWFLHVLSDPSLKHIGINMFALEVL